MANPNPSPETRFQPGNPGGGKTAEQKRLEYEAAEMAAQIRHKLLSVITEKMTRAADGDDGPLDFLNSDTLRLLKDSEDRAHGAPKQVNEIAGKDGGPITFADVTEIDDATLAAIAAGRSA